MVRRLETLGEFVSVVEDVLDGAWHAHSSEISRVLIAWTMSVLALAFRGGSVRCAHLQTTLPLTPVQGNLHSREQASAGIKYDKTSGRESDDVLQFVV